jgi:hypothetical protein
MRKSISATLDALQGDRSSLEIAIDAEYYVRGMIESEDNNLIWNWNGSEKRITRFDGLLEGFARLHSGSDERVLDFARRWGILHSCPWSPRPDAARPTATEGLRKRRTDEWQPLLDQLAAMHICFRKHPKGHTEGIDELKDLSREFDATLRIAYDLAMGQPGSHENWKLFFQLQKDRGRRRKCRRRQASADGEIKRCAFVRRCEATAPMEE